MRKQTHTLLDTGTIKETLNQRVASEFRRRHLWDKHLNNWERQRREKDKDRARDRERVREGVKYSFLYLWVCVFVKFLNT